MFCTLCTQERSRRGSKRYNYEGTVVSDPSTWKVTNRGKTYSYPVSNPKVGTEFTALVFDIVRKLQKMRVEFTQKNQKKNYDLFIFHFFKEVLLIPTIFIFLTALPLLTSASS